VPYDAATGNLAATNRPATWSSFRHAMQAYRNGDYTGVGYVFAAADPYVGLDLDNCVRPDGTIKRWALKLLDKLPSYAEVSPSGTGIKVFCRGSLPTEKGGRRRPVRDAAGKVIGQVEVYPQGQYFTVTGERVSTAPTGVTDCSEELGMLWESIRPAATVGSRAIPPVAISLTPAWVTDDVIIARARAARNGRRFAALWSGDTRAYGSPSSRPLSSASAKDRNSPNTRRRNRPCCSS